MSTPKTKCKGFFANLHFFENKLTKYIFCNKLIPVLKNNDNLWFLFGLTKERYHLYMRP